MSATYAASSSDPSSMSLDDALDDDNTSTYVYYMVLGVIIILIAGLAFGFISCYTKRGQMSWRNKSRRCRGCQKRLDLEEKVHKRNDEKLWCCRPNMYYCSSCQNRA